jgi:hypothetical protein
MSEPIFSAVYSYKTFFLLFSARATRRAERVQRHPPLIVVWLQWATTAHLIFNKKSLIAERIPLDMYSNLTTIGAQSGKKWDAVVKRFRKQGRTKE